MGPDHRAWQTSGTRNCRSVRESATSSPSRSSEPCRTESLESLPRGLVRPRGLFIRVIRTRRSLETFARHLHAFFAMRNWGFAGASEFYSSHTMTYSTFTLAKITRTNARLDLNDTYPSISASAYATMAE